MEIPLQKSSMPKKIKEGKKSFEIRPNARTHTKFWGLKSSAIQINFALSGWAMGPRSIYVFTEVRRGIAEKRSLKSKPVLYLSF